ncbi:MAG: SocA family protein [Magnetococcales bacterium]|nr:SocA family protein [Magnetococcales bacterium]NGZ27609.1 SocA family protein [Magnetococcales bacterium]
MVMDHSREKLFQAMGYFITKTQNCYKAKLFKLLYFLDFKHYQETGRPVTGLSYNAWPMGPVPVSLYEEINNKNSNLVEKFSITEKPHTKGHSVVIKPTFEINLQLFTRRELRIMEGLVAAYKDADASTMVEETHLENQPWDTVYKKNGDRQALIPYSMAIRASEQEIMKSVIHEREQFLASFGEMR